MKTLRQIVNIHDILFYVQQKFTLLLIFEGLEKCVSFFNAMHSVLLANECLVNETQIVRDCTASLSSACDSIGVDSAVIRALIMVSIL